MDWVHCNSCFRQPGEKKFFLTNCGHLVCEVCQEKWPANRCLVCNEACNITNLSEKNINPEIKAYFGAPAELALKISKELPEIPISQLSGYYNKAITKLLMVLKFQNDHRKRYSRFIQEMLIKQRPVLQKLQRELEEYRIKRQVLEKENAICKTILSSPNMLKDSSSVKHPSSKSPLNNLKDRPVITTTRKKPNSNDSTGFSFVQNVNADHHLLSDVTNTLTTMQLTTPVNSNNMGRRNLPNDVIGSNGSRHSSITLGPARLSMRTPPVNARIDLAAVAS